MPLDHLNLKVIDFEIFAVVPDLNMAIICRTFRNVNIVVIAIFNSKKRRIDYE
jgi:hypothetical protein